MLSVKPNDDRMRPSKRDITSAIVDHRGGTMVNEYWGVSLEIPENALPPGEQKEIYFVISDPRLCETNGPPLDLENGNSLFRTSVHAQDRIYLSFVIFFCCMCKFDPVNIF